MKHETLNELLQKVIDKANGKSITLKEVFTVLKHRGLAILIVIFSAPFLFPFQVPGFSIVFGIGTLYMGLQIALPRHEIFPKWLSNKVISYPVLKKWIRGTQWILEKVNKIVFHRLGSLVHRSWIIHFNGWCVFFLSFIFIIPIPLPFTNFLAAVPIFLIGLGLTEEDGLFILLAYALGILCIIAFVLIIYYGYESFEWMEKLAEYYS